MIELKQKLNIRYYIWIIVIGFFVVFVNSMASPIYDVSFLNDDAHLFYVIGRGIKYGKVPYIDLFDHKGLYIFFIAFLGSLIEYNHIGLFLVLDLFVVVNGIFVYKTMKMFLDEIGALLVSVLIMILQSCYFFSLGAFECETFLLTFIDIAYYLFVRYLNKIDYIKFSKEIKDNNKVFSNKDVNFEHNCKDMFWQGVLAGIVLMMKPNICFLWGLIGLIIFVILFKHKLYKNILTNIVFGMLGVIVALIPCIVYCLANDCFYDMIYGTFIFNMKYMSKTVYEYGGFIKKMKLWLSNFWGVYLCIIISLIVILKNKILHMVFKISYISLFAISMIIIILANRPYVYYANILFPFFIPTIAFFYNKIKSVLRSDVTNKIVFICIICMLCFGSLLIGRNLSYQSQEHLYRSAEVIKKVYKKYYKNKKNVNVFAIGDSAFVFNALNVLPEERYFFTPKISYEYNKDVYDEIYDYIDSKKSDFIVVCLNDILVINKEITTKYFDLLDEKYKLVSNELGLYIYKKK